MDEQELQAIRAARLRELQQRTEKSSSASASASANTQLLTPDANERLSRVRLVRPERAQQVEEYIMRLAQSGQLRRQVTDDELVEILSGAARSGGSNNVNITFSRKGESQNVPSKAASNDDDSEDDFFD